MVHYFPPNFLLIAMAFGAITDAANALKRLHDVFEAELIMDTRIRDPSLHFAVELKEASFTWDSPPPEMNDENEQKRASNDEKTGVNSEVPPTSEKEKEFKLDKINLEIPRGILLAIVGPIGSGKSSLLMGMIGEMRKTGGNVKFGGSVAYCAQNAWIQVGDQPFPLLFTSREWVRTQRSEKTSVLDVRLTGKG
jgi:ABC-type multidrug transport system fused ATPase/permease subunit